MSDVGKWKPLIGHSKLSRVSLKKLADRKERARIVTRCACAVVSIIARTGDDQIARCERYERDSRSILLHADRFGTLNIIDIARPNA